MAPDALLRRQTPRTLKGNCDRPPSGVAGEGTARPVGRDEGIIQLSVDEHLDIAASKWFRCRFYEMAGRSLVGSQRPCADNPLCRRRPDS